MLDKKLEFRIGLFVFIGIIILTIFVLLIGDIKTWNQGYSIVVKYGFINGVKVGAPVRFAGVDVGEVKEIKIVTDTKNKKTVVDIVAWMKKDVAIPSDSSVWINTLGLLGEKYIEIMPGVNYDAALKSNDTILGVDPIPMHEVFRVAKGIVDNIDDSITRIKNKEGTLGKLLYDDALYDEILGLAGDIRRNPWKLFWKTKEKKEDPVKSKADGAKPKLDSRTGNRGVIYSK
ncbi:MAG: MlaD family protein [Candidatus Omnitrophica bacterium]|nr:MlaD family protein [Candidatus Omnitrophota bacterium]MDD5654031.1 MlaD family protein [Candidatus Omnitrophota bacterium]